MAYKLEDQENRNKEKPENLPEATQREDLEIMKKIFNPLLGRAMSEPLKIEKVHRFKRPLGIPIETPRDIIVRFHNYEEKAQIWGSLRGVSTLKYETQIFANLSHETMRRRHLKPLLEQMRKHNIQYNWGFLACLVGWKEGRSAKLRVPEELQEFCKKFELPAPDISGWSNIRNE